ncbi:MAG: hypothetical protein IJA80_07815 [Clostridia bacterium]|nr:hypothetical protein [Clostridia bacterium]
MSVLKCEMCGGTLEIEGNGQYAVCAYCGTRKALPQSNTANKTTSPVDVNSGKTAQDETSRLENERKREEARARAEEAKVRAEENRLKAESQRLERERLAEKNRTEKAKKSKARGKTFLKVLISFILVVAIGTLTVTVIIPSVRYSGAVKNVEEKNYEEAYLTFKSLRRFKDSKSQASTLLKEHPEVAQVGDIITFGNYEQDNKTANGKEEIEWKVLEKDENGKMFLISRYALDCRHYHSSVEQVTWETSDIRSWLNNDFYKTAFDNTERAKIKTTTLENRDNADYNTDGGNDTKDKVFLLSIDEAKAYLPSTVERVCIATKYAESQGSQLEGLTRSCRWWLRSPGSTLYNASFVKIDGFILQLGTPVSVEKRSVRPAIWVEL